MAERYLPRPNDGRLIRGRASAYTPPHPPIYRPFIPGALGVYDVRLGIDAGAERRKLLAYGAAIVLVSALTQPEWLALALCIVLLLAGREAAAMLRRAIFATIAFSGVVSLAYLAQIHWLHQRIPWDWLIGINLRALVMALLTFTFIQRTNLFAALAFSERLSLMLVLAVSQALGLRRTLDDFRLALRCRGPGRIRLRDRYRAAAHTAGWLLDRVLANAHESAQALQARGLFK